ncbi:MAG: tetratricopeptide repeat protein, partial [Aliifodinibius sp.]|nr:tetratricopeptide repeat protein [Fodinibius sp.]
MIVKKITSIIVLSIAIFGCASTKSIDKSNSLQSEPDPKAVDYYRSGALYDFQEQYEKALLEYYQALLYDSTSSQILKAIGRDLIRTHRFESAKEYLQRSLKYDPNDKETLY